ncbi:hypothetical protein GCM10012288_03800 [Malaciobacter pacificus]|uniref:Uncharacterized protein n=1 Tax=Malaciobacter pacificus TaxID=1080223 RepID=A0A5C2H440_9BACT|nr:hypothetical protein [Malaciobacter pacificus]QEP33760.1 hypothetical protein APAC_0611 [Malaciobacter pacificus]GGD33077.1 hypothetical protein GCM10012288_03800 [Malaciobacter pacificus]
MKNSFTLFEIILSIIISSLVIIYSLAYSKELLETNKKAYELEVKKTNLLSTKVFLQKHKKDISKLSYKNSNLYFDNNLLLENIKNFNLNIVDNIIFIEINLDNTIKQKWSF